MDTSSSLSVDSPAMLEVRDYETGQIFSAAEVIGNDYQNVIQLRMKIKQSNSIKKPIFLCPVCSATLHLVSLAKERKFYFRHEVEDGMCPIKTKACLSPQQILAMKYDGARESIAHQRIKNFVAQSLLCDPDFSEVKVEEVWKGIEKNTRRKPDVRAIWKGNLPVAFEIQLSTTFLQVIAERRNFYLKEGGLIFWIFKDFNFLNSRLMQDDIFFNNNQNAFIVNEETLKKSIVERKFLMDCTWLEPSIHLDNIVWKQKDDTVPFSALTFEIQTQRAFFFDSDREKQKCLTDLKYQSLRKEFKELWLTECERNHDEKWRELIERLRDENITISLNEIQGKKLRCLLDTLYSVEAGRPVGAWRYANLVQLGHHIFDRYKEYLWAFRCMLNAHNRIDLIRKQDTTKNWQKNKVKLYRQAWKENNPEFAPDTKYNQQYLFFFLKLQMS